MRNFTTLVFLTFISFALSANTETPSLDMVKLISMLFNAETAKNVITVLSIMIAITAQLRALIPTKIFNKLPRMVVVMIDWFVGNYGASKNMQ